MHIRKIEMKDLDKYQISTTLTFPIPSPKTLGRPLILEQHAASLQIWQLAFTCLLQWHAPRLWTANHTLSMQQLRKRRTDFLPGCRLTASNITSRVDAFLRRVRLERFLKDLEHERWEVFYVQRLKETGPFSSVRYEAELFCLEFVQELDDTESFSWDWSKGVAIYPGRENDIQSGGICVRHVIFHPLFL